MAGDQLIVSPVSLSFQAPIAHSQKRMITMINAGDEDVIYRIEIDNATDYSVFPMRGEVKAFDTSELTVTLVPVTKDIPHCSLVVRSIPMSMVAHKGEVDWNSTDILIELDPKKEEPIGMNVETEKLVKPESQSTGCQTISYAPMSLFKLFLYFLALVAVVVAVYSSFCSKCKHIFDVHIF